MKKDISLRIMTRELCHKLYRDWENDPRSMAIPTVCTAAAAGAGFAAALLVCRLGRAMGVCRRHTS